MKEKPIIINIMADGTIRDSVEGVVIKSELFYQVAQGIIERKFTKKEK